MLNEAWIRSPFIARVGSVILTFMFCGGGFLRGLMFWHIAMMIVPAFLYYTLRLFTKDDAHVNWRELVILSVVIVFLLVAPLDLFRFPPVLALKVPPQ
jgi:heme O synthase-like polyprenyltransferase